MQSGEVSNFERKTKNEFPTSLSARKGLLIKIAIKRAYIPHQKARAYDRPKHRLHHEVHKTQSC